MRILIIGKSRVARVFTDCLCENNKNNGDNLVFTTMQGTNGNYVDIPPNDVAELKDFALANEMNLTIIVDLELLEKDFVKEFHEADLAVFAPDPEALKIVSSRAWGLKFMYKNKIQTPKFGVFEKPQLAIEYARAAGFPLVVKTDEPSSQCPPQLCKTYAKAEAAIEKLFDECAKRVVLQAFVEGREFTYYVITDGYNALPLDSVATFNGKFAYLDANFIDDEMHDKILKSTVKPVISALEKYSTGYTGILGFDFVLTDRNELFVLEFKHFFNDLDVELFTAGIEEDWAKLFNSAIVGSLADDFSEIKKTSRCYMSAKSENDCILEDGITLNQAREKLAEFDDMKEVCAWKF